MSEKNACKWVGRNVGPWNSAEKNVCRKSQCAHRSAQHEMAAVTLDQTIPKRTKLQPKIWAMGGVAAHLPESTGWSKCACCWPKAGNTHLYNNNNIFSFDWMNLSFVFCITTGLVWLYAKYFIFSVQFSLFNDFLNWKVRVERERMI